MKRKILDDKDGFMRASIGCIKELADSHNQKIMFLKKQAETSLMEFEKRRDEVWKTIFAYINTNNLYDEKISQKTHMLGYDDECEVVICERIKDKKKETFGEWLTNNFL